MAIPTRIPLSEAAKRRVLLLGVCFGVGFSIFADRLIGSPLGPVKGGGADNLSFCVL